MKHLSKQTETNDGYDYSQLERPYVIWDPSNEVVVWGPIEHLA